MKKSIYINLFPAVLPVFPIVAQVFNYYISPVFYGIYNYFTCKNIKDMVKMCSISLVSQLIGLFLAEILLYIASFDYNDFAETPALLVANLLITLALDGVLVGIKSLKERCDRKQLIITYDMKVQSEIREILAVNNIDYTVNPIMGLYGSVQAEYKIYVHKKDYEKACYLIKDVFR